jgi:hypothetical protein
MYAAQDEGEDPLPVPRVQLFERAVIAGSGRRDELWLVGRGDHQRIAQRECHATLLELGDGTGGAPEALN